MLTAKTGFTLPYTFTDLEGKAASEREMLGISQVCATDEFLCFVSAGKRRWDMTHLSMPWCCESAFALHHHHSAAFVWDESLVEGSKRNYLVSASHLGSEMASNRKEPSEEPPFVCFRTVADKWVKKKKSIFDTFLKQWHGVFLGVCLFEHFLEILVLRIHF